MQETGTAKSSQITENIGLGVRNFMTDYVMLRHALNRYSRIISLFEQFVIVVEDYRCRLLKFYDRVNEV